MTAKNTLLEVTTLLMGDMATLDPHMSIEHCHESEVSGFTVISAMMPMRVECVWSDTSISDYDVVAAAGDTLGAHWSQALDEESFVEGTTDVAFAVLIPASWRDLPFATLRQSMLQDTIGIYKVTSDRPLNTPNRFTIAQFTELAKFYGLQRDIQEEWIDSAIINGRMFPSS